MSETSPLYNPDGPRQNVTISGQSFSIPAPFKPVGKTLREVDAAVLNSAYADAIRSNMAKPIKEMAEGGIDRNTMESEVEDYCAIYDFGMRRGGGRRPTDPVEKELRDIAAREVKELIVAKGFQISKVPTKKFNELVDQMIERNPQWRKVAQDLVTARENAVGQSEKSIELDLTAEDLKEEGNSNSDSQSSAA